MDPNLITAHVNLISIYGREGRPDLAERHYRKAVELNSREAEAHYNYGVMLANNGRIADAQIAFARALQANPRHPQAHNNLGYLFMQKGSLHSAERHFRLAIENEPNHRLAHFHLGQILAARKAYGEAIHHFTRILAPDDDQTPGFTYALAATHARAGHTAKALQLARVARDKASRWGQADLMASIDRDIRVLERRR